MIKEAILKLTNKQDLSYEEAERLRRYRKAHICPF